MLKDPAPFDQGLFMMYLQKGKDYLDQGQLQRAREELESAYNLRPQDEKVLNMLGMTYYKLGMLPQAEEMYVTLATSNPGIYTLQSNLGLIRLKLEKLEESAESLSRALELQPSNPKAHFYLGLLYEKMGKWDKALLHFEEAKADKMISKMRERIAEEEQKTEILLPFEVLEVLSEEEQSAQQQIEEMDVLPEAEPMEIFGGAGDSNVEQSSVHDVINDPAEDVLSVDDQEITPITRNWDDGTTTGKMKRRSDTETIQEEEAFPTFEEELVEDTSANISDGSEEDTLIVETNFAEEVSRWERTHSGEAESKSGGNEASAESDSSVSESSSFLLPEETAADISAFLAQSRGGDDSVEEGLENESEEETSFIEGDLPTVDSSILDKFFQATIPTPDEVENEPAEAESSPLFENGEPLIPNEQPEELSGFSEQTILSEGTYGNEPMEKPLPSSAEPFSFEEDVSEQTQIMDPDTSFLVLRDFSQQTEFVEDNGMEKQPGINEEISSENVQEELEISEASDSMGSNPHSEDYAPANLDQFSRERLYVQPLIGSDRFLLIDPHLLEIVVSDKLVCRKGTISSYTGNLQFQSWNLEYEERIPLIQIAGSGILFLADRRKEIFTLSLNNEVILVEANHLLVAQSALKVEPYTLPQGELEKEFSMVKISGRGTLAITCQTRPLTLNVYDGMPVNIPAEALIAWSGNLDSYPIWDRELRKVMNSEDETTLLRFTGNGGVVVEQGSLWGDRRAQK